MSSVPDNEIVVLTGAYASEAQLQKELNVDPDAPQKQANPPLPAAIPLGLPPQLRLMKKWCGFRATKLQVWEAFSRTGVMNKWSQSSDSLLDMGKGVARWYGGAMQGVPYQVVDQAQLVMSKFWLSQWEDRNKANLYEPYSDSWVVIELDEYQPAVDGDKPIIRVRVWHWGFPNYMLNSNFQPVDTLQDLSTHWDKYVFGRISQFLQFKQEPVPWDWW